LKNTLKRIAANGLYRTGLFQWLRRPDANLAILKLHRVVTEEDRANSLNKPMMVTEAQFESLLKAIRQYCRPMALLDAVQQIREGRTFEPGSVAITFDDGYRDVYERAYPLLRSYDIPATLFVTTGVIDNPQHYLWWDEVDYLCRTGGAGTDLLLGEDPSDERRRAVSCISQLQENRSADNEAKTRQAFSRMPLAERTRVVGRIREMASGSGPRAQLMLSWDDIRAMSGLFEIASHTVNHPLLSRLETPEIRQEIEEARLRIEKETASTCKGLAYPSGDFSDNAVSIAESLGFEYAVTTRFSNNSHTSDCMRLGRKDARYLYLDDAISPAYFNVVMSGATDWLRGHGSVRTAGEAAASAVNLPGGTVTGKDKPRDSDTRPLIVHVVHHLTVGGLENGLVNLVNRLPQAGYRHAIVCLTDYSDFRNRIERPDVEVYALHKRPGKGLKIYLDLWRVFRRLKPDVVHTRNIATLEAQLPALLAGVPHRVHGEHGRDTRDIDGGNRKYRLLRKAFRPVISRYIALSQDLQQYLQVQIGVSGHKISHICNGVDTERFRPAETGPEAMLPEGFDGEGVVVIGAVGRMEPEKDPTTLAEAFIRLVNEHPQARQRLRLVMLGDGMLLEPVKTLLEKGGVRELAWLPGERDDVPLLLRALDVFVLSSLVEGISNTILEAMASGLPVVASRVGGNSEIVDQGVTGLLVPRRDPAALATAIQRYVEDPQLRRRHGAAARRCVEEMFSIDNMVQHYHALYGNLLDTGRKAAPLSRSS
jgi:sugar transferase (PEP-CTERM/EpsH1 system associated)